MASSEILSTIASPITDAPKVLHLWVALGTLAGPSDPIPQLKIHTFFELSPVLADYSTININP